MNKKFYLMFVALLVPFILSANNAPPIWRAPTADELGQDSGWRNEDTDHYLLVKADFDGDGKEDVARLLVNDKDNKMGLFVTLAAAKNASPLLLETIEDKRLIEVFGIAVAKPGRFTTACGKGYWDCERNEPEQVHLTRPAIDFFKYESANSYFIWNTGMKKFDRIWMSD
jgi:hypothetical protein